MAYQAPVVDEIQLMTGIDVPSPSLHITFHQPRLREIAILNETDYFLALNLFMADKESMKI